MTEIPFANFDLAGATIADEGHVLSAFQAALLAHAIPLTNEMLLPRRGKRETLRFLIEQKYGRNAESHAERIKTAESDFHEELAKSFETIGVPPVAGAEAALAWLRERVIDTGVEQLGNTYLLANVADLPTSLEREL